MLWFVPFFSGGSRRQVGLEYNKWTDIKDTFEFAQKLIDEENVLCLPGECFFKSGFVRIGIHILSGFVGPAHVVLVISHPADILKEACERMTNFCNRHAKSN